MTRYFFDFTIKDIVKFFNVGNLCLDGLGWVICECLAMCEA